MTIKGVVLTIAAFALAACDGASGSSFESQLDNLNANWNTLADGSKFALANDPERDREIAMRCWPNKDGSHLCLSVVENRAAFGVTTVYRSVESSLPPMLWGLGADGYHCKQLMGLREEVADGDDALITNNLQETGRPWSRAFVDDYTTQNKVTGSGHFRCLEVLRAILGGSLKTLGTTSITKAMAT